MARAVVLLEERPHRPLVGLHRAPDQKGIIDVAVGATRQGKEEDARHPRGRRIHEDSTLKKVRDPKRI